MLVMEWNAVRWFRFRVFIVGGWIKASHVLGERRGTGGKKNSLGDYL